MSRSILKWPIITKTNPKSPISEAYKMLRTNLDFTNLGESALCSIMVTSSLMGEGKSTTSANLAVTNAQLNRSVLLIDADLRRPSQQHIFNVSNQVGLSNVLSGQAMFEDAIQDTAIDHLQVLTAGPIPPNPSEMLASSRMSTLLEKAKDWFDVIILDTPPMLGLTDSQILASRCDGVILVVKSGRLKKELAAKVKSSLEHVNARVLGAVLNDINRKNAQDYYYYYGERK